MTEPQYDQTDADNFYLAQENRALRKTLGTLITWMATSANSPINTYEAAQLLKMLEGKE